MVRKKILAVDDEEDILELLSYNLSRNGYDVTAVTTGEKALKEVRENEYDAVLLDLMLPGVDGLDVCRILKNDSKTAHIPVIMLTARGEESDVVSGLELGADDYVTKPFSPKVLVARIRAVMRRKAAAADNKTTIKVHDLVINPGRHEVTAGKETISLTATEFRILHMLARRSGWVFTRNQIIDAVRGEGYPVTDRSVDVHIAGLRKKLGKHGNYIETVRGVGYRFKE